MLQAEHNIRSLYVSVNDFILLQLLKRKKQVEKRGKYKILAPRLRLLENFLNLHTLLLNHENPRLTFKRIQKIDYIRLFNTR